MFAVRRESQSMNNHKIRNSYTITKTICTNSFQEKRNNRKIKTEKGRIGRLFNKYCEKTQQEVTTMKGIEEKFQHCKKFNHQSNRIVEEHRKQRERKNRELFRIRSS